MYWLPRRQMPKMKHNQTLHLLDEQGRSYCQIENVARKRDLDWVKFEEPGGRSVCKNCLIVKEGNSLTKECDSIVH